MASGMVVSSPTMAMQPTNQLDAMNELALARHRFRLAAERVAAAEAAGDAAALARWEITMAQCCRAYTKALKSPQS